MAIKIKRSSGDIAPSSLAAGQLAYSEGATNGGTLYYGEIGGTVREIAGKKFVDKLNGVAVGAIANVVEDTTPQLGGSLDVNGQSIVSASNGNISITPNGTGNVVLDGVNWPQADGTANQFLKTNGSGQLSYATITQANGNELENIVEDTTPQLGGNLDVQTNSIVTSATNGDIAITPNGTGAVLVGSNTAVASSYTAFAHNSGDSVNGMLAQFPLKITGHNGSDPAQIILTGGDISFGNGTVTGMTVDGATATLTGGITNGDFTIAANGTGNVNLDADTVRVGDNNAAATITTNGTGNLVLNTNAGTNSGSITLAQGVNGAISIAANGTGVVSVTSPIVANITSTVNTPTIFARHTVTASASDTYPSINIQKHRSDIAFTSMTDEPAVAQFQVRDSTNANRTFFRMIGRYQGTATNPVFTLRGSPNGFTTDLHYMGIGGGVATFGSGSSDYTLTANTGGALKLTANSNTDSGVITIASGVDGTISLQPNGVGKLLLDNVYWPVSDGSANQVLKTDGAGQASWVSASSLVTDVNTTYAVSAETATGGANLRLTGSDASTDDVKIAGGTNVTVTRTDANTITISSADTGITDLVQDTTPQLGGALDVNGNSIVSVSNGNITLAPNGTGKVVISGDLQIDGTTTTINSTTLDVDDLNITVAKGAANAAAANGAGLTVEGPTTAATILYDGTNDRWALNKRTSLSGILYPAADGTAGQFVKTNGSGVLSFETITQANGNELENVVEDTTPQLGGNLDVNGNSIVSASNGNIAITPNGTGSIVLDGLNWPQADGSANYVLKTNGSGQLSWVAQTTDTNTTYTVSAETVASGANLRLTGSDASTDDVAILGGTNVTVTRTDANTITISSADTGITDLVQDTTPQLGGSLDVNGQSIVSATNGNIAITPNGTGSIVLDGLSWPQADGSANYVLKTNGSGQLSWVAQSAGVTTFIALSDVPASYSGTGGYYVKVNSGATALEFSQDVDDGTF